MILRLIFALLVCLYSQLALSVVRTVVMDPQKLCSSIFELNGLAYFCYDHEQFGKELHVSDGSKFGTTIVKDIDAGPGDSSVSEIFKFRNHLYFIAETSATGWALWQTDGTEAGTRRLKNLSSLKDRYQPHFSRPHSQTYSPFNIELGGRVFFRIFDRLFATDGTGAGTQEIDTTVEVEFERANAQLYNNHLYFISAITSPDVDRPILRRVNAVGNVEDVLTFRANGAFITDFLVNGNMLIQISEPDPEIAHNEGPDPQFWLSNGTEAGTAFLRSAFLIDVVGEISGDLIYINHNQPVEEQLRKSKDLITSERINTGLPSLFGSDDRFVRNNKIYMHIQSSGTLVNDGSTEGTEILPLQYHQLSFWNASAVGADGSLVGVPLFGNDLLYSDGTAAGTRAIESFGSLNDIIKVAGRFFLFAEGQLWVTNGRRNAATQVTSFGDYSGFEFEGFEGNRVFFSVRDFGNSYQFQLWQSNGETSYPLKYRYEDGTPPPPVSASSPLSWLIAVLDLVLSDTDDE